MSTSTSSALPNGFRARLRDDLIVADSGRLLVGGSPVRAIRLSDRARALLRGDHLLVDSPAAGVLARRLLDGNLADPVVDDVKVPLADLTVVVPVRDRPDQLDRCLSALMPLAVIVVDDASHDPAAVARVAHRHGARLVQLTTNRGPAGARNVGLTRVRTPLVAFVDSDVEVGASALRDLARHCADPDVALVGPRVVGRVRSGRTRWFERYDAAASSVDLGRVGGRVQPGAAIGWLPSACLVGQAALLGSSSGGIDGFEDTWRVAEDVDLVWRLVDAGHIVRYDPTVEVDHDVRATAREWLGRKFVYGTGAADLATRHGAKVAPAVLSVPMAVGAAALLQHRWWSAPVAGLVLLTTARSVRRHLPTANDADDNTGVVALRLASRGLGWAVRQEGALLLRHWWPISVVAAAKSRQVRRALLASLVVELGVFLHERPGCDPATALIARRLDDLAYGGGLWWGAIRRREPRCLFVRWLPWSR